MFDISAVRTDSKAGMYEDMNDFITGLFFEERDWLANMANLASLLYNIMPEVNWAGFYLFKESELVLGPFNGKPACIRITIGRGVCGTAAVTGETQLVKDVHAFPGHIACDGDTKSEIVVPIMKDGTLVGVLDLDSPVTNRFDEEDQKALEAIVLKLLEASNLPKA